MKNFQPLFALLLAPLLYGQPAQGPYKLLKTEKVGGLGGFDYVFADADGRRLYIPRGGAPGTPPGPGHVSVFNLDTLAPAGEIPNASARGPLSIRNPATALPVASPCSCGIPKR